MNLVIPKVGFLPLELHLGILPFYNNHSFVDTFDTLIDNINHNLKDYYNFLNHISILLIHFLNFEKYIFDNSKNDNKELKYDLENYNNPINYDLYYQSMYQMYPQMNDYYKKAKTQDEVLGGENQPLVLLNSSLLDPTQVNMMIESKIYSSLQQKDDERMNNIRNPKIIKNK